MALYTCPDCKRVFSSEAKSCPHCGWRQKSGCGAALGIVAVGLIGLLIIGFINQPPITDEQVAARMCEIFVKAKLRDPDSAEILSDSLTQKVLKEQDGSFTTFVRVRSNNEFGGKETSQFLCTVTKANGDWQPKTVVKWTSE